MNLDSGKELGSGNRALEWKHCVLSPGLLAFVSTVCFLFLSFSDARFFDLSSTSYSDNRQSAARLWHIWYNTTRLYTNRPGSKPYDGNIFGNKPGNRGKGGNKGGSKTLMPPRPTPAAEVTPTVGVYFRTDSQFSVEQSVATQVYDKASYGRST